MPSGGSKELAVLQSVEKTGWHECVPAGQGLRKREQDSSLMPMFFVLLLYGLGQLLNLSFSLSAKAK